MATKETSSSTVEPSKTAQTVDDANTSTNNEASVILSYCTIVGKQPPIEGGSDPQFQNYFNMKLTEAQKNANSYLSVQQPLIITNITNIGNYYALNSSVPTSLPQGSTDAQWTAILEKYEAQSLTNRATASRTLKMLSYFKNEIISDGAMFKEMLNGLESGNYPSGIIKAISLIFSQNQNAVQATITMLNTWEVLTTELDHLIEDLQQAIQTTGEIRKILLMVVNKVLQTVQQDISFIEDQNGIATSTDAKNRQTVSEKIKTSSTILTAGATPEMLKSADTYSSDSSAADGIDKANKAQSTQAIIIENYANSVNEQPNVHFSGTPGLEKYETEINNGLKTAQEHANKYLNVIQPSIIYNITNIQNYYAIQNSITKTFKAGSTKEQWIQVLTALENKSKEYKTASDGVTSRITTLHTNLTTESNNFWTIVGDLNKAVNGDNGVLETTKGQLVVIQKQIDAVNASTLASGLEIAGRAIMMISGNVFPPWVIGDFLPLVAGGLGIVVAGTGGEVSAAITLKNLNSQKQKILNEKSNLKDEVKLATGIAVALESLSIQVGNAVKAASNMEKTWEILSNYLRSLINDLNKGTKTSKELETIFLKAADTIIKRVLQDIQQIKLQMTGVDRIVAKGTQTVGEAIVEAAKGNQGVSMQTTMLLKTSQCNATSGGILTQSVANLNAAADQIKTIVNIPSEAQVIKNDSLANISQLVTQIQSLQGTVSVFVNQATPQLNAIETQLKSNQPMDEIKTAVDVVCGEANTLNTSVIRVIASIQSTITIIEGNFNQLDAVQKDLTNQMTQLQGQLGDAQSRESAAEKKYWYLLALGPFGLVGLAAALALYLSIKNEVDGYQKEINGLNSQIAALNSMKVSTGQLSASFQTVITSVSGVKNSVSFLSNDILEIQTDLSLGDSRTVIEIAVTAALNEVNTLGIDAS